MIGVQGQCSVARRGLPSLLQNPGKNQSDELEAFWKNEFNQGSVNVFLKKTKVIWRSNTVPPPQLLGHLLVSKLITDSLKPLHTLQSLSDNAWENSSRCKKNCTWWPLNQQSVSFSVAKCKRAERCTSRWKIHFGCQKQQSFQSILDCSAQIQIYRSNRFTFCLVILSISSLYHRWGRRTDANSLTCSSGKKFSPSQFNLGDQERRDGLFLKPAWRSWGEAGLHAAPFGLSGK